MRKYIDNTDIKKEIDILLIEKGITKKEIADKLGMSGQQLSNIFNKKNLSFSDIKDICNAIGCDLYIDIKDKE